MNLKSPLSAAAVALVLSVGFTAPSLAADDESGQKPPSEAQTEQKPPEEPKCVTSNTGYKQDGKTITFHIMLKNSCEKRFRCEVAAYHVGAHGPSNGQGRVTLAPKSKGEAASKSYVMKVKDFGGSVNYSEKCKAI